MRSPMAGLSTHLAAALLASAPRARFAGQPVRGRRLGGIGRVLLAQRQLVFQIRDLPFGVRNLPFGVRDLLFGVRDLLFGVRDLLLLFSDLFGLTAYLLVPVSQFPAQPFVLPRQIARQRIAMARTHPPYGS